MPNRGGSRPPRRRVNKLTARGLKIRCAKRNTASYAELLNMNELTLQIAWLVVGLRLLSSFYVSHWFYFY